MTTRAARRSSNAPHSGYQRVEAGEMLLLMDAGAPPPISVSQEAHAGCLSFELSHGLQRIVVNCGLPGTSRETWRQVARATAAHSTVMFNDTSSCRFLESGSFKRLLGAPIVGGPTDVQVVARGARRRRHPARLARRLCRPLQGGPSARAEARARRQPRSTARTCSSPTDGDMIPQDVADEFAVRFHLHPSVKANQLTDGHGVMLVLPNRDVWTFNAYEDRVEIEESVYLAGADGPRRTVQIVIYGRARKVPRVHWSLRRIAAAGSAGASAAASRDADERRTCPLAAP